MGEVSMDKAQGAAATGESEGPTPQPQPEPQPQPGPNDPPAPGIPAPSSLRGAVLAGMELPTAVLEAVQDPARGEPGPGEATPPQPEPEPEPQPPPPPTQQREKPIQEDWPDSAKSRVAEESEKRRQRTRERDAALVRN